jgi:hypothetical protein
MIFYRWILVFSKYALILFFYFCSPFSESADTVGAGMAVPAAQAGCMSMDEVFKLAVTSFKVYDWSLFDASRP